MLILWLYWSQDSATEDSKYRLGHNDHYISPLKSHRKRFKYLELYEGEFCLSGILVNEIVVALGEDVETVPLLRLKLGGVQDNCDLALKNKFRANMWKSERRWTCNLETGFNSRWLHQCLITSYLVAQKLDYCQTGKGSSPDRSRTLVPAGLRWFAKHKIYCMRGNSISTSTESWIGSPAV